MDVVDGSFLELYGFPHKDGKTDEERSCLEQWYNRIYSVPFSRFSVEDLARACRQNRFPDYIVPWVVNVLWGNPIAGELYDGELLISLTQLPSDFWEQNNACRSETISLLRNCNQYLLENLDEAGFDHEDYIMVQNFALFLRSL